MILTQNFLIKIQFLHGYLVEFSQGEKVDLNKLTK